MELYSLLRLAHFAGFILLGGGLSAVFVSEWQSYRASEPTVFAEGARYTAIFYDRLVLPGAVLAAASGILLVLRLDIGFFDAPWLVGMWGLFLFEFIEGNTLTRIQFRRTLRHTRPFARGEPLTEEKRREARTLLSQIVHFLDIPVFSVMVFCGVARPNRWASLGAAMAIAILAAAFLTIGIPRLAARLR